MGHKDIPESTIELVAMHINSRNNKPYPAIPVIGEPSNSETPQVFEILPFDDIDNSPHSFFAIDGSYNSQQFYNGLSIGVYTAGYLHYKNGKQERVNDIDDPIILGKSYFPSNILITNDEHLFAIYDELFSLPPVKNLFEFFGDEPENVLSYNKEAVCTSISTLLSFCQDILEWALVYEIACLPQINVNDFILKDGTLRPLQLKQKYMIKFAKFLKEKQVIIVGVTKNSPIKMELSSKFKQIDGYLQEKLKPQYPFIQKDPKRQKLCCWFEVPQDVLGNAYKTRNEDSQNMYIKKDIKGGRGFGLFTVARLDYVEKLQNYDWLVVDVNIFDAIPDIEKGLLERDLGRLSFIFRELTRLTQEHYILGYPYPLVEVHNFVTLKRNFKDEIIKKVKFALYKEQRMDNVDIENLFLDIHDRF